MTDVGAFKSPILEAMCWRISFTPAGTGASSDLLPFITVQEPYHVLAFAEEVDADLVLANQNLRDGDAVYLIWLPRSRAARSAELERRAGDWVRSSKGAEQPMVRGSIRTVSVMWSENRAVIQAAGEELHSAMDAVIRFTLAIRETMILEQQSAATWTDLEAHVELTHQVSSRDFRMQRKVNSMTERATRMKASYFRLNNAVQQIDRTLTAPSKLLFSELAFQADLLQRIELLEPPTQFFLDHYELSNTRLIEGRFNRKLLLMECGIILVLCAELAMFFVEVIQPLPPSKVVQTNAAAMHLAETLIKQKIKPYYTGLWPLSSDQPRNSQTTGPATEFVMPTAGAPSKPAPSKVVQTNTGAVHLGETLIKPSAPTKVVQTNAGAVHVGDALIKAPAPSKVVQTNAGAVHLGDALTQPPPSLPTEPVKPPALLPKPPPSKFAETTTGAIPPASESTIDPAPLPNRPNVIPKVQPLIPMPRPKMAPSSWVANASTGAVRRERDEQDSSIVPKAARPDWNKINRKPAEQTVTANRKAETARRSGTEHAPSVRPIVRKTKDKGDTTAVIAKPSTDATHADYQRLLPNQPKLAGKDRGQVRLSATPAPGLKMDNRRSRVSDGTDVRRAVEQLNNEDMRAFRSNCGQILSAPGKFPRSHVEICAAASL
jgi:hypothetical protein